MEVFEGSLGSGKSYCGIAVGIEYLIDGGLLATNFPLMDNWSWRLAGMSMRVKSGRVDQLELAHDYYDRCFHVGSVESIYQVSKLLPDLVKGKCKDRKDNKGMILWDEASLFFNSRNWKENFPYIKLFINMRKLKWDAVLLSHSEEDLDKQIRAKMEYISSFRNLQKVRVPFIGLHSPYPIFHRFTKYGGRGSLAGMKYKTQEYVLSKTIGSLYDTDEIFDENMIEGFTKQGQPPYVPVGKDAPQQIRNDDSFHKFAPASCWPCYHHNELEVF